MGNEILKKYSIKETPLFQTGFMGLWNVYQGIKKSTKEEVCIFIIEQKTLRKKYPESQKRKEIISLLKKSPLILSKLNNFHYLKIIENITEDNKILFFITEPFIKTLYSWILQSSPSKLEIKQIISQIIEGLLYLHNEFKFIHSCLNPHFIFIDKNGIIKITNLTFIQYEGYIEKIDYFKNNIYSFNNMLNFISPEIISEKNCNFKSDVFSIGCILFMLLKRYMNEKNKFFLGGINKFEDYEKLINNGDLNLFLNNINFLDEDNDFLKLILSQDFNKRCDLNNLLNNNWFNDPKLIALIQLKKLKQNKNEKEVKIFLNKFLKCIMFFENKVLEGKIIPYLINVLSSYNNNEEIVNLVLKNVLNICNKSMIQIQFEKNVWIHIKSYFIKENLSDFRIHLLLTKIDYLFKKLSSFEFDFTFTPIIYKILDDNNNKELQFFIINNLRNIYTSFQQNNLQEIYIKIIKILNNTNDNNLIIENLKTISVIYKKFNKKFIEESLIKSLGNILINSQTKREICDILIDLYINISEIISIEIIGNEVYPKLMHISMVGDINVKSFNLINNFIIKYYDKIKEYRSKQIVDFYFDNDDNQSINNNNIIKLTDSIIQEVDEKVLLNLFSEENNDNNNNNTNLNNNNNINNNYSNIINNNEDNNILNNENIIKNNSNNLNKELLIKNNSNNLNKELLIKNNSNNLNEKHLNIYSSNLNDEYSKNYNSEKIKEYNLNNTNNSNNISDENSISENSLDLVKEIKSHDIDLEAQNKYKKALKEEQEEIDKNILGKSSLRIEHENENYLSELNNLENYLNDQLINYNKKSNENFDYESLFFDRKKNIEKINNDNNSDN